MSWGRKAKRGILKRVLTSAGSLNINSTIANVTLQHFSVTLLEWITNPREVLMEEQWNVSARVTQKIKTYDDPNWFPLGGVALIPDSS